MTGGDLGLGTRVIRLPAAIAAALLIGCGNGAEYSFGDSLCDGCALDLIPGTRVAPDSQSARFLISTGLAISSDGTFFAAPLVQRASVASFSAGGEYLRSFGSRGSGPGEMEEIESLTISGADSVLAVDRTGRVSVFTARGEFGRAMQAGTSATVHDAASGDFIMADRFLGGGISRVARDGSRRTSIVAADRAGESRLVRVAEDGEIWSVDTAYQVEVYTESGELTSTADLSPFLGGADDRYSVRVADFLMIAPDLLMVLVARRDLQWQPPQQTAGGERAPRMLSVGEATELNHYYLDVVEPGQKRLLARRRLDGLFVGGFLGESQLYTVASDDRHELSLQTWDVQFAHPKRNRGGP